MNSSKKVIKGQSEKKVKKVTITAGGHGKQIAFGILIALLAILLVGVAWEGMAPKYLLSVNGEKLKKEDLIFDIYQSEGIGAQMASLYSQFGYTEDYFTMDNGDGTTTQDTLRDQTIESYVYNEVLYKAATDAGYAPTEEELKTIEESVAQDIESLTEDKAKKLGLTKEVLTERTMEETVVQRYKEDMIEGFDIDDEAIRAGVDYEKFRGYKVEYFSIATTETDDNGESKEVADKEAKKALLQGVLDKAAASSDWSKIIGEEEAEKSEVKYGTETLMKDDETYAEETRNKILAMSNGDKTGILEEDGYYIAFRMINNDDKENYEAEVKNQITEAEEKKFTEYYDGLKAGYNIKIYDKNWKDIAFGKITL